MSLEYHRYLLRSRDQGSLNSRSTRLEFPGSLIRLDGLGVGCIHPWPELGDASLEEELVALANGKPLQLGRCALECAKLDGEARREGRSLFEGLEIPPSHWTAGRLADPQKVAADGFRVAKLKLGADTRAAVAEVERWAACIGIERLRLDFNESLNAEGFLQFWSHLSDAARSRVEFIEDPVPFDAADWRRLSQEAGVVFALDREAETAADDWNDCLVLKAARMEQIKIDKLLSNKHRKYIFTSYMDHAIGQLWAAWTAACWNRGEENLEAGLLTHERFAGDPFFDGLVRNGPQLQVPPGTGLGFDHLLEALTWKPLT